MPQIMGTTGPTQPLVSSVNFANADGTTAKTIFASPTGPYRVESIIVTSNDTAAQILDIFMHVGVSSFLLGSVSIPAGTGFANTKGIDALAAVLPTTVVGIDIDQTRQIFAGMEAAVTATKQIQVTLLGGTY